MHFIKRNGGRLLMLILYVIACFAYAMFRQRLADGSLQINTDNLEMVVKVASVMMKLFAALFLVYVLMLIMKETQDRKYILEHPSAKKKIEKDKEIQNGSFRFNCFTAVIIVAFYIALYAAGFYAV